MSSLMRWIYFKWLGRAKPDRSMAPCEILLNGQTKRYIQEVFKITISQEMADWIKEHLI